jgi:hypothetical protein
VDFLIDMIDISDVTSDSLAVDVAVLTVAVVVAEAGGTDAVAGWAVVAATGGINNYCA